MPNVVIVTTTFTKSLDDLRFQLALKMCRVAHREGYPVICVDGSPILEAVAVLEECGAKVFKQEKPGMGPSRRQCIQAGLDTGADIIAWNEPEKHTMVPLLYYCINNLTFNQADIVIPRRCNLVGYPKYQQFSEYWANWELGDITGRHDLDLMVGTRILSRAGAELFLKYDPKDPTKDNWEILFIPILWAQWMKMGIGSVVVDYVHPPEQTAAEESNSEMDAKRDTQRNNILNTMREVKAEMVRRESAL